MDISHSWYCFYTQFVSLFVKVLVAEGRDLGLNFKVPPLAHEEDIHHMQRLLYDALSTDSKFNSLTDDPAPSLAHGSDESIRGEWMVIERIQIMILIQGDDMPSRLAI